ncbi:pyridoxine 5'-phosphate synthase [candidate division TA06 bacterium]|uniref:Pyridoxine 5'-phosphate synthase n=1 Tax=candidate division TA06 bacterium TaxID=2250710 RepID=A0A523URR2_UNCT6|nr:MAG: pyridoxine 5'-phosphate synthase [candidate division TA06 bacterium]
MVRLGLNIDHVATIREARRATEPDPVAAAIFAELAGVDQITIHLRGDRRHIQERDLRVLRKVIRTKLNLEMAATDAMRNIAVEIKPNSVCLVPEKPEEVTTEGGLDLSKATKDVKAILPQLREAGIRVTVFVEPDDQQIEMGKSLGVHAIEINTGQYAEAKTKGKIKSELERVATGASLATSLGLEVHAGHGLDYRNVIEIVNIPEIEELNIGHSIVSRAVFVGIDKAVREMLELLRE